MSDERIRVRCPECGRPTSSLKSLRIVDLMVFLVLGASTRARTVVACPRCARRVIARRTLANVLPAHIAWVFAILPWHAFQWARTFVPGHSAVVRAHLRRAAPSGGPAPRPTLSCLLAVVLSLAAALPAQESEGPTRLELTAADHYLQHFEKHVARGEGKRVELDYEGRRALRMIRELMKKHPQHAGVQDLFLRARKALRASKGETVEITGEILAYRGTEKRLRATLDRINAEAWEAAVARAREGAFIDDPFPAPDPMETPSSTLKGHRVVLSDFQFPMREFRQNGRSWVWIGAPSRGSYFVDVSSRSFVGPYEAIKRYRRQVCPELPGSWTVLGRITGARIMVPDASKKKRLAALAGWTVRVEAVWVDGFAMAVPDETDSGGHFAGEDRVESILAEGWTVRSIADDASPKTVVETLIMAGKERNFGLYKTLIAPELQKTALQKESVVRAWTRVQEAIADRWCHGVAFRTEEIEVVSGAIRERDLESFFLDEEDQEELAKEKMPVIEDVVVLVKLYDERGKVVGSPRPVRLRRRDGGPWRVRAGHSF